MGASLMDELEIVRALNELSSKELERTIYRAKALLEKKKQMEAEQEAKEKERQRLEKIEQEKRRQEEIAELQRKLKELQSQSMDEQQEPTKIKGDGFVMYDSASAQAKPSAAPAQSTAPAKPQTPQTLSCPHCHQPNPAGSVFCSNCGQRIAAQPAAPSSSAPVTSPASNARIRYANESMKKWEMLPGENILRNQLDIELIQPIVPGNFKYYMSVTNKRILFSREGAAAANAKMAARMGAGLVGSLIAEGISSAKGGGPKPWLEIPMTAITNCGVQGKKEFFIDAGQTFVLKNHGYEKYLPTFVMRAKQGG